MGFEPTTLSLGSYRSRRDLQGSGADGGIACANPVAIAGAVERRTGPRDLAGLRVAVAFEHELGARVAEDLRDAVRANARAQERRRVAVAQIVEPRERRRELDKRRRRV